MVLLQSIVSTTRQISTRQLCLQNGNFRLICGHQEISVWPDLLVGTPKF
jgi:hypothetical protein